jgi:hypothetical protein
MATRLQRQIINKASILCAANFFVSMGINEMYRACGAARCLFTALAQSNHFFPSRHALSTVSAFSSAHDDATFTRARINDPKARPTAVEAFEPANDFFNFHGAPPSRKNLTIPLKQRLMTSGDMR